VGSLELFRVRRVTPLIGIAAIFFVHAVFPTALLKALLFPDLPFLPIWRLGHLGSQMSSTGLRLVAGWHFIPLFPPTLLVIAGVSAFLSRNLRPDRERITWPRVLAAAQSALPFL